MLCSSIRNDVLLVRIALLLLLLWTGISFAQSPLDLDCRENQPPGGRALVCEYSMLTRQNDNLTNFYSRLLKERPHRSVDIIAWLSQRDACSDVPCLDRFFDSRIPEIQSLLDSPDSIEAKQPLSSAISALDAHEVSNTDTSIPAADNSPQPTTTKQTIAAQPRSNNQKPEKSTLLLPSPPVSSAPGHLARAAPRNTSGSPINPVGRRHSAPGYVSSSDKATLSASVEPGPTLPVAKNEAKATSRFSGLFEQFSTDYMVGVSLIIIVFIVLGVMLVISVIYSPLFPREENPLPQQEPSNPPTNHRNDQQPKPISQLS